MYSSTSQQMIPNGRAGPYVSSMPPQCAVVVINAIVYAEFSIGYTRIEKVDRVLADAGLELIQIPRAALFLAGKVFQRYRAHGGSRTGVLLDFFIGAHAAVAQLPLLTAATGATFRVLL
jgi:predicted nucleic acid-binding protein